MFPLAKAKPVAHAYPAVLDRMEHGCPYDVQETHPHSGRSPDLPAFPAQQSGRCP
ncbi:hypothetical protein ACWDBD_45665 [Streptomyces sp. NPDC001118]